MVFASADAADETSAYIDIRIHSFSAMNIRIRIDTLYIEDDARITEYLYYSRLSIVSTKRNKKNLYLNEVHLLLHCVDTYS